MHPQLSQWHSALDDYHALMRDPQPHRDQLLAAAAALHAQGVIDALTQFAMVELAQEAYLHAIEELLSDYLQPNGTYAVLAANGSQVGEFAGYRLYFGNGLASKDYSLMAFRGRNGFAVVDTALHASIGQLQHRGMRMIDGATYRITETSRRIDGVEYPTITDPQCYRALLDLHQLALEASQPQRDAALRQRLQVAAFKQCGVCRDNFALREGCHHCQGLGFVGTQ